MNRKILLSVAFAAVWAALGVGAFYVAGAHTDTARARTGPSPAADVRPLGQQGCSVRFAADSGGRLRLTVDLAQPGRLEVRATADDGDNYVNQTEPAGESTLTVPVPLPMLKALTVTEFTADGAVLACGIAPAG